MLKSFAEYSKAVEKINRQVRISNPTINANIVSQMGADKEKLDKILAKLCKHWWGVDAPMPDCSGKRLITSILASKLQDPDIISIISDDVELFKLHKKEGNDLFYLEFCCLCGAENIVNEIYLKKDKKQYIIDSKDAIAYAVSSGNANLAITLATTAKKNGKVSPGLLDLYSEGNEVCAYAISKIFSAPSATLKI